MFVCNYQRLSKPNTIETYSRLQFAQCTCIIIQFARGCTL